MRILLLFITSVFTHNCFSQKNTFTQFTQDTIKLSNISFNKTTGLILNEATIFIESGFFEKKLREEHKGCKKNIKKINRIKKSDSATAKILQYQLKTALAAFSGLDSAYKFLKKNKKQCDTLFFPFRLFFANSRFGDFIPSLIETNQCAVADKFLKPQYIIIRQTGWTKSGSNSSGSKYFFLPGCNNYFWAKWMWST